MGNEQPVILVEEQTGLDHLLYVCYGLVLHAVREYYPDGRPAGNLVGGRICYVSDVEEELGSPYHHAGETHREHASLVLLGLCAGVSCLTPRKETLHNAGGET